MYSDDIRKKLLVKSLRKSGWAVVPNGEKDLLRKGKYFVRLEDDYFILLTSLVPEELIQVEEIRYGRRQSQRLKRAIDSHRRESELCGSHISNLKGDR